MPLRAQTQMEVLWVLAGNSPGQALVNNRRQAVAVMTDAHLTVVAVMAQRPLITMEPPTRNYSFDSQWPTTNYVRSWAQGPKQDLHPTAPRHSRSRPYQRLAVLDQVT